MEPEWEDRVIMKIETVQISNFRSIDFCEIGSCAGFNVLIGKNNSGKSNVLSAINAFFWVIKQGNIVCLDPPINRTLDFHNRNTSTPVEVAITFHLDQTERQEMLSGLVDEQSGLMDHGFDRIFKPGLLLRLRVAFHLDPANFACISGISLVRPNDTDDHVELIVLDFDHQVAQKLYQQSLDMQEINALVARLRPYLSIDAQGWADIMRGLAPWHDDAFAFSTTSEDAQILDDVAANVDTFEDFRAQLVIEIDRLESQDPNSPLFSLVMEHADYMSLEGIGSRFIFPSLVPLRALANFEVLPITEHRRTIGREDAELLFGLKNTREGRERWRRIQDRASALFGISLDALSGGQSNGAGGQSPELDVDDFLVEANGAGIREALRLLLDVELQEPHLILMEEPEVHLHPALESAVAEYLGQISAGQQIFVATHSTNLLDRTDTQNIYLVSKDGSTAVLRLDQNGAQERIPAELGLRLSSLFMFDRLVFVESRIDELMIRTWATTLGINLNRSNVGFIHMNGARYLNYFASSGALEFLDTRRVEMLFLIDRDEKDEADIAKISEAFGEKTTIYPLDKREIENYLIHPRVLMIQIKEKMKATNRENEGPTDQKKVAALIDQAAESLKEFTIFKHIAKTILRPLYPDTIRHMESMEGRTIEETIDGQMSEWESIILGLRIDTATMIRECRVGVEASWPARKLDLVSGDLLIDTIYRSFGVRFHKARLDGVTLAGLMTKNEIGTELEELISSIAA